MSTLLDVVERLSLYVGANINGEQRPITTEAIKTCVVRLQFEDTWALVNAINDRNLKEPLRILRDCFDPREGGLMMLGAIAWSVRQLLSFALARKRGVGIDEAGRASGMFQPQRAREADQRLKKLSIAELTRWMSLIAETDTALKGSKRPGEVVMETLIVRMCSR
jgi:DNA polymerase III subunit delta